MKTFLLTITTCFALVVNSFAQCPDAGITDPGFHPPADQLPSIEQGIPYDETVQINIPATFDTLGLTATIDSIYVNSLTGQPSGITYSCNPPSCTFNGGTAGCITFTGTTNDPVGQYDLTISVTAYVTVPFLGQQVQTLDLSQLGFSYYLTVSIPVFVRQVDDFNLNVFPNPTTGMFTLAHPNLQTPASVSIFDMTGKRVFEENINETGAIRRQVDLTALPKGIYSLQMISETGKGVQRLTIY